MEFLVDVTKFYIGLFSHDTNVMHSYSGVAFVCVYVCWRNHVSHSHMRADVFRLYSAVWFIALLAPADHD